MRSRRFALAAGSCAVALAPMLGCGPAEPARYPPGVAIALLGGPVHLGDNQAGSQNFSSGPATGARLCSLVNLPRPAYAHLQAINVQNTETLGDILTVNGVSYPLGITLERDPRGVTPNAMKASPVFQLQLEKGPSEICLVSGLKLNGDVDDFQVDQLNLYVQGVDAVEVDVRQGLGMGNPPPSAPPSTPWGRNQ